MSENRIEEITKKMSELKKELRREKSRIAEEERKKETRKKIVLGGRLMRLAETDQRANDVLRVALSALSESERELFAGFDLPVVQPSASF